MKAATPHGPDPLDVIAEWNFKSGSMRDMTVAVCRLALDRGAGGVFSALDLEQHGAAAHGGTGIAGTVFQTLAGWGVISPVGGFVDGDFLQRRVRNTNGNPIGVWRLGAAHLAKRLIEVHGGQKLERIQPELNMA